VAGLLVDPVYLALVELYRVRSLSWRWKNGWRGSTRASPRAGTGGTMTTWSSGSWRTASSPSTKPSPSSPRPLYPINFVRQKHQTFMVLFHYNSHLSFSLCLKLCLLYPLSMILGSESMVHFSQQQLVTFEQMQLNNWGQAFPSNFYQFRFRIIV